MYKFLKIQYKLKRITREELYSFVNKYITFEQYKEIIGE